MKRKDGQLTSIIAGSHGWARLRHAFDKEE
jgi:hypothetical protein